MCSPTSRSLNPMYFWNASRPIDFTIARCFVQSGTVWSHTWLGEYPSTGLSMHTGTVHFRWLIHLANPGGGAIRPINIRRSSAT